MKVDSISSLAKFILSSECRSIGVLTGAGVSVASGIPDFRSVGGLYDTLRPDLITATPAQRSLMKHEPMSVVTWEMFQQTQFPYMEVRRPFILGTQKQQWKATIAHRFFELLYTKTSTDDDRDGKLTRIYTQNIDGLDHQTTIPKDKIVNVHGTISEAACEGCGTSMDMKEFCSLVEANIKDIYQSRPNGSPKESKPILCSNCHRPLVKPRTVLFGRDLPRAFFELSEQDLPTLDLLIIAGTSLVVSPANSLVYRCPPSTKRVVVNLEPVGEDLGIRCCEDDSAGRDCFIQGDCDEVFLDLITELGWLDDLHAIADLLPARSAELVQQKVIIMGKNNDANHRTR